MIQKCSVSKQGKNKRLNSSQLSTWAHKCHYSCKSVNVNGLKINLQLWDIPGHERFGGMTRVHYKVILCIFYYKNAQNMTKLFMLEKERPKN